MAVFFTLILSWDPEMRWFQHIMNENYANLIGIWNLVIWVEDIFSWWFDFNCLCKVSLSGNKCLRVICRPWLHARRQHTWVPPWSVPGSSSTASPIFPWTAGARRQPCHVLPLSQYVNLCSFIEMQFKGLCGFSLGRMIISCISDIVLFWCLGVEFCWL